VGSNPTLSAKLEKPQSCGFSLFSGVYDDFRMEKSFRIWNENSLSGNYFRGKMLTLLTAQKVKDAAKAWIIPAATAARKAESFCLMISPPYFHPLRRTMHRGIF